MTIYTKQELDNIKELDKLRKIADNLGVQSVSKAQRKTVINKIITAQNKIGLFDTTINISTFYIQINKSNLLDFFGSALIYPVNYDIRDLARSQRTKDVQHLVPNHLLISDGFTDEPDESQVLLEVSLSEIDKQNLEEISERIYLLGYPLPISRVNKIHFASEESQINSIATAKTYQDTFLPEHIFTIWHKIENRAKDVMRIDVKKIPVNKTLKTENQNQFNRVLGMLAFMKNAELYYTNETFEFAAYSEKYFNVLSLINPFFEVPEVRKMDNNNLLYYKALLQLENNKVQLTLQQIVKSIYDNESFRKDILRRILGMPPEEVKNAFQLLVTDETLSALHAIDQLKQPMPELVLLAFLYRFRDKNGSDKYALKKQIPYLINRKTLKSRALNRTSIVLATLGLYYGYRNLPKDEEIILNDNYLSSFAENSHFSIKYKLDNFLDRVTIESVYQFCFFKTQLTTFEYLIDDKKVIKYQLIDGYDDKKTFSIIENYPIIRISKEHTNQQKQVKSKTKSIIEIITPLYTFLKKNGLVQSEMRFDENEFDIWLHTNSCIELETILTKLKK